MNGLNFIMPGLPMRMFVFLFACHLTFLTLNSSTAQSRGERGDPPGEFDYYTLVLNWSPTYCEGEGRGDGGQQCSGMRPYAFVLHGLWPQYQRDWPEFCRTRERPWVPDDLIDSMLDIMPSKRLIIHEYRKHGTCSGLSPRDYYSTARKMFETIKIPDQFKRPAQAITLAPEDVKREFLKNNPDLQPEMIEVSCNRNRLRDVRICYNRDGKLRNCGDNERGRRLCHSSRVTLPPVRFIQQGI
jgi:ribonuclease T2